MSYVDDLKTLSGHSHLGRWEQLCESPDHEVRDAWRAKVGRMARGEEEIAPVRANPASAAGQGQDLPPATTMLANAAGAIWRLGVQWMTGGAIFTTPEELDRRLAICQLCDAWTGSRCTDCGCFGALKARLESEKGECPRGKWDSGKG